MAITCPYCGHSMKLKDVKPGRYKPKCGKCSRRFSLRISQDPDRPPRIKPLDAPSQPPAGSEETMPHQTQAEPHDQGSSSTPPGAGKSPPPEKHLERTDRESRANKTAPGNVDETMAHDVSATATTGPATSAQQTTGNTDATMAPDEGSFAAQQAKASETKPERDGSDDVDYSLSDQVATASDNRLPFTSLGGYKLLKELGSGAMGSVYLARQMSLDRNVALKTVQARWAEDPSAVARFTREAYAAAQLTHHNVVQIYDLGSDRGTNFFSMEFVQGESLAELLESQQKLDPPTAVGYVLQAARGLQFAHSHGMVHRDIKPANLMLSDQGVVKVADLGLVKTPDFDESQSADEKSEIALAVAKSGVTMANVAMGTPAYMAPEQGDNAAGVDHRADIYSLGCTLYVLLTGRPLFQGESALEVITKHKTEPVVRPERIDQAVPGDLSEIVMKMIAKEPQQRYQNLAAVVTDLEKFLGNSQAIQTEHVSTLEQSVSNFNKAKAPRIRKLVALAFVLGCLALAMVGLFVSFSFAGGMLALLATATLTYFTIGGLRERTALFDRARQFLLTSRWTDWLSWGVGLLLLVVVLYVLGMLAPWVAFMVVGIGAGLAMHLVLDKRVQRERAGAIRQTEETLKSLRLRGLDETALHDFVAKYGGDSWEEFFEALFGYEAKIAARQRLTAAGHKPRKRFRAWREPIINGIEARLKNQRAEKDRRHLEKVEAAGLQASGVDAEQARAQAAGMAAAVMDHAADVAQEQSSSAEAVDPKRLAEEKRQRMKAMLAEARSGKYSRKRGITRFITGPLGFLLGGKLRFLLGGGLLVGCLLWMNHNGMISGEQVRQAIEDGDLDAPGELLSQTAQKVGETKPLGIPVVGGLVSSYFAGIAGLYLLASSLFRGWKMSVFALPSAALIVAGPLFGQGLLGLVAGGILGVVGLLLGRAPRG